MDRVCRSFPLAPSRPATAVRTKVRWRGFCVGLRQLTADVEVAYVTSCDAPLVRPEFVEALYRRRAEFEVVVPRDETFHHPLAAIYHRNVVDRIDDLLHAGRRRPIFLFERAATLEVDVETLRAVDPHLATLQNVNTPADYERLCRRRP